MNPIIIIITVVLLGLVLVPSLWVLVVKLLSALSPKFKSSIFIAAGHLKGRRKRGFVSIIGIISIYAICASSCHVITVLSIMGGFGDDLKKKILGAKAHIIIDSTEGLVDSEDEVLEAIEGVPEIVGAYPYIEEEVMVRSPLNISGAVVRGFNIDEALKVTNLGEIVEEGKLQYIKHPENILSEVYRQPLVYVSPLDAIKESKESVQEKGKGPVKVKKKESDPGGGERDGPGGKRDAGDKDVFPAVVVGREMSKNLGIFVGDDVKLISPLGDIGPTGPIPKIRVFRAGAIFFSGMYEYDAKNVYVSLDVAREFLGIKEGVTGIEVKVEKPQHVERVAEAIKARLKELKKGKQKLRVRHWKELNRSLFSALLLEKIGMFLMLSLTILVASFSIISTLTMLVMEKSQDIAVLKTIGASDGMILKVFHFQGTLIGLVGTMVGVSLGVLLCFSIEHFGISINPEVHYIDKLPVNMEPVEIFLVAAASLLICMLITLYPARMASKISVLEGLRNR
ncbi:MAG: FtsX-like permease family protein [Pseudomonadota bacterium]